MDAKVTWREGLHFDGTANSGFVVPLGSDLAAGGADDGFRPLELLRIGLAGCTAMDVISILQKKQQQVTAFVVKVHTDQAAEPPKVFTRARLTYQVSGHSVDEAALRRSIELSVTKYCPAYTMLSKAVPIELYYEIYEGENLANSKLIKSGTYTLQ
jgi:putative redox protein